MTTYAIKWREPSGQTFIGRLAFGARTLRLDGRRSGVNEPPVYRHLRYDELQSLRIGSRGADRLDGRPALVVEWLEGAYLFAGAGQGAPIVQELVDRLVELRRRRRAGRRKSAANPQPDCAPPPIETTPFRLYVGATNRSKGGTTMRKLFVIGGIVAGLVLVVFGAAAISMGIDGRTTVRDSLKAEQITFGAADDPAVAKFAPQWADEQVTTGTQARAFAQVMHEHALEGSDGLAYAQMGRFVSAADPENAAGTSDEAAALKDEKGNPVSNTARNTWVTATALSTALNVSYMAEQMALFGIVVGIALLLSGFGFIILALGGALRGRELAPVVKREPTSARQPAGVTS